MADYAIHDTTLTAIANTIRKKDGTAALIDPADYADRINLMGMLEEKTTTSASIAHIEDGASEVPLKNWLVTLPASLTGYSSIVGTKSGKNLYDIDGAVYNGDFYDASGNVVKYADCAVSWIKVNPSTKYSFSCTKETSQTVNVRIAWCKSDKSFISRQGLFSDNQFPMTLTTPSNCEWVQLSVNQYGASYIAQNNWSIQVEQNDTASTFGAYSGTTYTASLGRTIYGGTADIVTGEGEDENGNAFTFTPIAPTPETENVCNFWADEGDSSVTYRSVGTVQPAPTPTLITKTITENGTYDAEDDSADGYSFVEVEVYQGDGGLPITLVATEIATDANLTGTLTFTEDYHDYPILKVRTYHPTNQDYMDIYCTPQFIDDAFAYSSNKANFNRMGTNLYAYYGAGANNTWVRGGYRTIIVTSVFGISSNTHDIEVGNLYRYQAITANNRDVSFSGSIFDYQYLAIGMCDGDTTETEPSVPIVPVANSGIGEIALFGAGSAYAVTRTFVLEEHRVRDYATTNKYGFFTIDGINFIKKHST